MEALGISTIILFVVALVFVFKTINVVPQQHAWVVERLGKYHATLAPGLNIVIPFIDRIAYKHIRSMCRRRCASRATIRSCRSTASSISR